MPDLTCPACHSTRVVPEVSILDYNSMVSPLTITVPLKNPEQTSILGVIPATRDRVSGTLMARVCGDCGHAELYSPEFAKIWVGYSGEAAS